jgi:hypothetical protein
MRDRHITDDDHTRLIVAASPTLRVITNMACLTGQRIGDVLKIKHSDICPDFITFIQDSTGKTTQGCDDADTGRKHQGGPAAPRRDYTELPARAKKR